MATRWWPGTTNPTLIIDDVDLHYSAYKTALRDLESDPCLCFGFWSCTSRTGLTLSFVYRNTSPLEQYPDGIAAWTLTCDGSIVPRVSQSRHGKLSKSYHPYTTYIHTCIDQINTPLSLPNKYFDRVSFYGEHVTRLSLETPWNSAKRYIAENERKWPPTISVPGRPLLPNLEDLSLCLAGNLEDNRICLDWAHMLISPALRYFFLRIGTTADPEKAFNLVGDVLARCPNILNLSLNIPHSSGRQPEVWDFLVSQIVPPSLKLIRLNPEPLSSQTLLWIAQMPQLSGMDIHLPNNLITSIPMRSLYRLTSLRVRCKYLPTLMDLWRTDMVANLSVLSIILCCTPTFDLEIGHFFSVVSEVSAQLRELKVMLRSPISFSTLLNLHLPFLRSLTVRAALLRSDGYPVLRTAGEQWPLLEVLCLECEVETNDLLRVSIYLPSLNELGIMLPKILTLKGVDTSHLSPGTLQGLSAIWQSHPFSLRSTQRRLCQYQGSSLDTLAK